MNQANDEKICIRSFDLVYQQANQLENLPERNFQFHLAYDVKQLDKTYQWTICWTRWRTYQWSQSLVEPPWSSQFFHLVFSKPANQLENFPVFLADEISNSKWYMIMIQTWAWLFETYVNFMYKPLIIENISLFKNKIVV